MDNINIKKHRIIYISLPIKLEIINFYLLFQFDIFIIEYNIFLFFIFILTKIKNDLKYF
jgi:hypothetical protein